MFLLAAISLGFLGSFHCIGMCGPIALAIPVKKSSRFSIFSGSLMYNLGRMATYATMGLVFGLVGQGFALAGWQNTLSIVLGIVILMLVFIPTISFFSINRGFMYNRFSKLKSALGALFSNHSKKSLFIIGLLNGLLPCGLVYIGIAGSIATGSVVHGSLFMAAFGLGTFPAMMTLNFMRSYITPSFRTRIRRVVPFFAATMGLLLILRGMNLDIPYLSPAVKTTNGVTIHHCCHK
jgi:sulfite exporter TauE/SafE